MLTSSTRCTPVSHGSKHSTAHSSPRLVTVRAETQSKASCSSSSSSTMAEPVPRAFTATGPQPQKFSVAKGQLVAVLSACGPFVMRGGLGAFAMGYRAAIAVDDPKVYSLVRVAGRMLKESSDTSSYKRPEKPLELYEFEGCPFCKKAREAMTLLDLDPIVRPCPVNGATWRPAAIKLGGKRMFPFLVDSNTGKQMYESDDIIAYLFNEYGPGADKVPFLLRAGFLTTLTAGLGLLPRALVGSKARKSRLPEKPLRVWMVEASPFVKLVREQLCELELPYQQITCPRGSAKRQVMLDTYGTFQVPMLEDPNTGEQLFESTAIMEYLKRTYESKDE